ncbi:hypothetical protein HYT92_03405 [Candidatus Pacearchaeota archaeon]|nr:hypothetical protein [Candidatus Pacearchaeota archaeon]
MNRNVIIVIVLVVLVLLTAVQAIQLNALKTSISTGKVGVGSPVQSPGSGGGVPSNIQDLPSMVGGC